ncbi:MAG: hypothetical protein PHQ41_11195 [Candidatus Cloacimonetes bacterium]|nr:hypothetical protein [Candidatus Cloacimonadota bacterium]
MRILKNLSEFLRNDENRTLLLNAGSDMELYNYVHKIEDIICASVAD